jgi:hypothetical protein
VVPIGGNIHKAIEGLVATARQEFGCAASDEDD